MKTILFDNIIYSLQQSGGISAIWAMLQNGLMHNNEANLLFIERDDAINNIYRKKVYFPIENLVRLKHNFPLIVDRYRSIKVQGITPAIFHSSYYRCIDDKDVKSVVTVHDFTYERYMSGLRRYVHCKQKYEAINNADVVVCVSENTRKDLLHYIPNITEDKIRVVHNGVSNDFYKLEDATRRDRLLYVGSRAKYKNFDFLVESISETSYCLDICGAPISIKEQEYLNRKLGINRYNVYSNVDNAILNELYNQAKCLIYPSSYEGFGLPIVEAQKTGCPVIALNSSSIPEIIGETPLLLNELSRKELLSALEMIESPTLFENVSKMGLENAKKYTSQSMIDGYRNIYSELLE